MIDVHVHLAALPTRDNACLLSPKMLRSPLLKFIAWRQGLPLDDPETANRRYVDRLADELSRSKKVSQAVLLGMDGVYGEDGRLDAPHTDFMIPNDAVFDAVKRAPGLLAGVSINPKRRDAVDELERCFLLGAVLVKILPNAQSFDPTDPRFVPFYRAMARLGIPLLSHIGYEFSLIGQDQSVGNPERLVPALEQGVTVIAAHGCSTGLFFYEKHFAAMERLIARYPHFYSDVSALSLPNRLGGLLGLRRRPELSGRLVFGTDYPLPCLSYGLAAGIESPFDRQVAFLEALGVRPGADFTALMPRQNPR